MVASNDDIIGYELKIEEVLDSSSLWCPLRSCTKLLLPPLV